MYSNTYIVFENLFPEIYDLGPKKSRLCALKKKERCCSETKVNNSTGQTTLMDPV